MVLLIYQMTYEKKIWFAMKMKLEKLSNFKETCELPNLFLDIYKRMIIKASARFFARNLGMK